MNDGARAPGWEALAAELADVGVPREQARVYVHLLRRGPSGAGDVAQALGLSRPRVYRLLDGLSHQGFIATGTGRPRRFAAARPPVVLSALRDRALGTLGHLDRVQAILASRLEALREQADEERDAPHFTVVRSLNALASAAQELYSGAQERIEVLLGRDGTQRLAPALLGCPALAGRAAQGLTVRVLAPAQAKLPLPKEPPVQRRHLGEEALASLALADGRDVLLVVDAAPQGSVRESALGVRSNAASFVSMQEILFRRLWEGARIPPRSSSAK
jgi:sugar-specific transcriptional regulator TrmB